MQKASSVTGCLGPIPWENDTTRLMSDQLNPKTQAEDDCLEVAHHSTQLLNPMKTTLTVACESFRCWRDIS